jgi:hypothetical protein
VFQYIQNYLPIAESLAVILGVGFLATQIKQQTEIARENHDRKKKQSTIEFYNTISLESERFSDNIGGKFWDTKSILSNEVSNKSVSRYLSRLERLAIGVKSDIYDFETIYIMSGDYLIKRYEELKEYIEYTREARILKNHYREFELMVKRLENRRKGYLSEMVTNDIIVKLP